MREKSKSRLVKTIPSPYCEDYNYHWGFASFRNKTVLDIGADYGSTASYFLQNGAKRVIAIESNPKLFSRLIAHFRDDALVTAINLEVREPQQIENLITKFKPDILKADCEGCELHLIEVAKRTLKTVPEFLIETHDQFFKRRVSSRIERLFRTLGYKYATYEVSPFWNAKVKVRIVHAKRKWNTLTFREDEIACLRISLRGSRRIQEQRFFRILEHQSGPLGALLILYAERTDLRRAFPEVREGDYSRLLLWARNVVERRTDAYQVLQPHAQWIRNNSITGPEDLESQLTATKAELAAIKGSLGFRFLRVYASTISRLLQRRT